MKRTEAVGILESSSYRMTKPRLNVLDVVLKQKGPFSTEDVHRAVNRSKKTDSCDLATVYRTLAIFEELKIISRCDFSDEMARYELASVDHHGHHHHHFVCKSCGRIEHLEMCILDAQEQMLKKLGYTELSHRLEFSGLCPSCTP